MRKRFLPAWLRTTLAASAADRYYPVVVGFFAFAITLTFSFPFGAVLVPATLLAPKRWLSLGLVCGLGSGLGASALVQIFHFVGWETISEHYPDLVQMQSWQWVADWLQRYGLLALLVIAASPLPQTPALLVYAMVDPFWPGVLVAIGTGKALKYTLLTWLTARYPGRFLKFY
jgi:membrane protein YqaA with SNARE-associated domain